MLLEAAPCVAHAPIGLDGHIGIVVDVPPEVYELVYLVVHLAHCLYYAVLNPIPYVVCWTGKMSAY